MNLNIIFPLQILIDLNCFGSNVYIIGKLDTIRRNQEPDSIKTSSWNNFLEKKKKKTAFWSQRLIQLILDFCLGVASSKALSSLYLLTKICSMATILES